MAVPLPVYLHEVAAAMRAAGEDNGPAGFLDHIADEADGAHPGVWAEGVPEAVEVARHWEHEHPGLVTA